MLKKEDNLLFHCLALNHSKLSYFQVTELPKLFPIIFFILFTVSNAKAYLHQNDLIFQQFGNNLVIILWLCKVFTD